MKSTTAFALVASLLPFAMAMPYNMEHVERDADADAAYEVDWVTDVKVATVYTQITEYWTGEPAATTTYAAPSTSSAVLVETSSAPARNRQHNGNGRGRKSTVDYTIEKTTTPEPAPTSTSTVAPPPETTSTSAWVAAPAPTTLITIAPPPAPVTTSTSTSAPAPVSSNTSSGQKNIYGLDMGPADYAGPPNFTPSGYNSELRADYLSSSDFKTGILQSANAWRAKWGAGEVTWADDLAAIAQKSVNSGCGPDHTGAQNFQWGTNLTPQGAMSSWGSEAIAWRESPRNGSEPPISLLPPKTSPETGHFTQVVWKGASSIGCAVRDCSTPDGAYNPMIFVACNWDKGNELDHFTSQVNSLPTY